MFEIVQSNARGMGMVVNPTKTQLLCIAPANSAEVTSHIYLEDGSRIESGEEMTLLGFRFSSRPMVAAHLELLKQKFNCRVWMLRHLRNAGIAERTVAEIYAAIIRPVVEYAVPVYHWMLNGGQSDEVEKMQRRAMKIIYGHKTSYRAALEKSALPTLKERRKNIVLKFAQKASSSDLYDHWFPTRTYEHNTRHQKKYCEFHANTDRLYKSPLFSMRRCLNE